MVNATLEEEIINKVFSLLKYGFKSIDALEQQINARKSIIRKFPGICRKPAAIAVLTVDVVNSLNLSRKQITGAFSEMQNKLDIEATQWAALKQTIEEKGSDEAIKGWLSALSATLEEELRPVSYTHLTLPTIYSV